MTINKNSTEQINVALLDLDNKIRRNNQTATIAKLESDINAINDTLKEKQNGLIPGNTYDINISGNAATSNHSSTADNATTADSANTAADAGHAINADHATTSDNATNATHAAVADYATSAGSAASAPIVFPEGYVYKQYYNPTTESWEKTPGQMNMQVPSGYKWTEITTDFSAYPYSKISTTETGDGHNAEHTHGMNHKHRMEHTHAKGTLSASTSSQTICYRTGATGTPSLNAATSNAYQIGFARAASTISGNTASGSYADSYTGGSRTFASTTADETVKSETDTSGTSTYPEPSYHGCKLWKVVVDE